MIKTLYLAIEDKLKTIQTPDGEQLFKHFDLWNQQVEFLEEETPFDTPAVFIEFGTFDWKTLPRRLQECEASIRIHVVTPWFANTPENTPEPYRSQALEYLTLPSVIVAALQNFTIAPDGSLERANSWTRVKSEVNHNHERYVDSVETYSCHIFDKSATPEYSKSRIQSYRITMSDAFTGIWQNGTKGKR